MTTVESLHTETNATVRVTATPSYSREDVRFIIGHVVLDMSHREWERVADAVAKVLGTVDA